MQDLAALAAVEGSAGFDPLEFAEVGHPVLLVAVAVDLCHQRVSAHLFRLDRVQMIGGLRDLDLHLGRLAVELLLRPEACRIRTCLARSVVVAAAAAAVQLSRWVWYCRNDKRR